MSVRGNRFQSSVLTFGPVGRLVATVAVLAVLYWFVMVAGMFGLVGAVVWIGWVMPKALRDIWRPAALPATDLTRLRDAAIREHAPGPSEAHPLFDADQPPPPRW